MQPVGITIRQWRVRRKMTQEALAKRSRVSRPNLSAIEQGGRDLNVGTLRRIALALGANPGALVDGVAPSPEHAPAGLGRFAIDRIARLAAGERLSASPKEKKLALELGFIMKSKVGWTDTKKRRRTAREENETHARLKAELGREMLTHLVKRVEKHLAGAS